MGLSSGGCGLLWLCFLLTSAGGYSAQVTVNATNVTRTLYKTVGVNLDYLVDSDEAFPRTVALSEALSDLGAGTLRFPMGELADRYLFKYDAMNQEDVSRCSIQGDIAPSKWSYYVDQSDGAFPDAMTTSNFVDLVQAAGSVPFFCVGIDAILKDRNYGQTDRSEVEGYWQNYTAVSKAEVYAAASNWVEYVKDLGVTGAYWEIGNENYLDNTEIGGWVAEKYAEVVNDLSEIIKSVDSTAQIGCNGGTYYQSDWWDDVLPLVEDSVDFIVVHEYLGGNLAEYTNYIAYTSSLTPEYDLAKTKRDTVVSAGNRYRIKFCITETSSHIPGNTYPNNLGKALINFNLIGDLLSKTPVSHLHFWVTRYLTASKFVSGSWSGLYKDEGALDDDNNLLPQGQVLQLWNAFSYNQLLETQDDQDSLVVYASSRSSDGALTVFLLNRSLSGESVTVTLDGFNGNPLNNHWLFSGTDTDDTAPGLTHMASVGLTNNTFDVWAMPHSITIVEFAPKFELGQPYNLVSYNSGSLLELEQPTEDGGNAVIWEDRGNWSKQEWVFVKDADGYYEVVNQAVGSGKRLEVADPWQPDCNVVGWSDLGDWAKQKWTVGYDSAGGFVLINKATDKALEVLNGGMTNGASVQVGDENGWSKQRWLIVPAP